MYAFFNARFSAIDKIDAIYKSQLTLERKVASIDFHRLIDTIDIDQHNFIVWSVTPMRCDDVTHHSLITRFSLCESFYSCGTWQCYQRRTPACSYYQSL